MRRAGRVVAEMLDRISTAVRPGVTTAELDAIGRAVLADRGATSNFLGYHGFPAVICASPNEVIVHGIPGPRVLEEGDIISIDCGAIVDGWHGDAAVTVGVGTIDAGSQRLIDTAEAALAAGIAELVDGGRLGNVGEVVQRVGESAGFSVVEEYTGHAIGQAMHESPAVPNFGRRGSGAKLKVGNAYAIEPMFCAGSAETRTLADNWTVVTVDGARAAHVEHSIAITDHGPEILTLP